MLRAAGIDDEALATNFEERKELTEFLSAERSPQPSKAYEYGSRLGGRISYAAGITGLYAAGHIAETIRLLSTAMTRIGPGNALTVVAALPAVVDTMLRPDTMQKGDIAVARDVCTHVFSRYGADIDEAWRARESIENLAKFHMGSDGIDEAFHRFFRIARTLEESGNHEAGDVRDACFPGILAAGRDALSELTAPECMYYAFFAATTGRDWPPLNRDDFDYWLADGPRLRIDARGPRRTVELLDSPSRGRHKGARKKTQ